MSEQLDWKQVKAVAVSLGVKEKTIEQWRTRRSVPHRWRLPLIEATDGKISAEAFKNGSAVTAD